MKKNKPVNRACLHTTTNRSLILHETFASLGMDEFFELNLEFK